MFRFTFYKPKSYEKLIRILDIHNFKKVNFANLIRMPRSKNFEEPVEPEEESTAPSPLDSESPIDTDHLEEQINQLKQNEKINIRRAIELEMELHSAKADRDLYKR